RRRHTRFSRDWSSDVCSSDLQALAQTATHPVRVRFAVEVDAQEGKIHWYEPLDPETDTSLAEELLHALVFSVPNKAALVSGEVEIGRASCRERGELGGVG